MFFSFLSFFAIIKVIQINIDTLFMSSKLYIRYVIAILLVNFSFIAVTFADSKLTIPGGSDSYNVTKSYKPNDTIRISTTTNIINTPISLTVEGFEKQGGSWVTQPFTKDDDKLNITSDFSVGPDIIENISSLNGSKLRLKVSEFEVAGDKRTTWINKILSTSTQDNVLEEDLFVNGLSLGSINSSSHSIETYIEAKVEAVCTKPGTSTYVYQGESYTTESASTSTEYTCKSDWTFQESKTCKGGYSMVAGACTSTNTAPTIASTQTLEINENTTSEFGPVMASDPGDIITYSITGGSDKALFTINSSTGKLKPTTALNYESKKSYTIIVTASDSSISASGTVTINVKDIIEAQCNTAARYGSSDSAAGNLCTSGSLVSTSFTTLAGVNKYSWTCSLGGETVECEAPQKIDGVCNTEYDGKNKTDTELNFLGQASTRPDICTTGTIKNWNYNSGEYKATWDCLNTNGGNTANCSVNEKKNGICGTTKNKCGSSNDENSITNSFSESATGSQWKCAGKNGGDSTTCESSNTYCSVYKKSGTVNFDHVLYGKGSSIKIANANGEIPQSPNQLDIINTLNNNAGDSWQNYTSADDNDGNNTNDQSSYDLDDNGTEYYVYPNKFRYSVDKIKDSSNDIVGYKIYKLSCSNEGVLSGNRQVDISNGVCIKAEYHWNNETKTCEQSSVDFSISNTNGSSTTEKNSFQASINNESFYLYPQIKNNSDYDGQDITFTIEYNKDILEYKSNSLLSGSNQQWESNGSTNGKIILRLKSGKKFSANSTLNVSIEFKPLQIATEEANIVTYSLESSQDSTEENNTFSLSGTITPTNILLSNNSIKEYKEGGTNGIDTFTSVGTLSSSSADKFSLCSTSEVFNISGTTLQKINGEKINFEETSSYNLCINAYKITGTTETLIGTKDFTIDIIDINEGQIIKTGDNIPTVHISVDSATGAATKKLTFSELGITNDIDIDDKHTMEDMYIIEIIENPALTGATAVIGSTTAGEDQYKKYITYNLPSSSGTNTDLIKYKLCDNNPAPGSSNTETVTPQGAQQCSTHTIKIVLDNGSACTDPFGTEQLNSGEKIENIFTTRTQDAINNDPFCTQKKTLICSNAQWFFTDTAGTATGSVISGIPANYTKVCNPKSNFTPTITDENKTYFGISNNETSPKEILVGETFNLEPKITTGTDTPLEEFFLSIRFDKEKFKTIKMPDSIQCSTKETSETKTCITTNAFTISTEKVFNEILLQATGKDTDGTDIIYTVIYPKANGTKTSVSSTIYTTILERTLDPKSTTISGVKNETSRDITRLLSTKVATENLEEFSFTLSTDASKCSITQDDNKFFQITSGPTLKISSSQKFDTASKKACIRIAKGDITVGYDTVNTVLDDTKTLVLVSDPIVEESSTGIIGKIYASAGITEIQACSQDASYSVSAGDSSIIKASTLNTSTVNISSGSIDITKKTELFEKPNISPDQVFSISVADATSIDYESAGENKTYNICLQGKGLNGEDTGEQIFKFPIIDINEAPQKTNRTLAEPVSYGTVKTLTFTDLNIKNDTDKDEDDTASELSIIKIFIGENVPQNIDSSTQWTTSISEIGKYSFEVSPDKKTILAKNLGINSLSADNKFTLHYILCDNGSDNTPIAKTGASPSNICSISSITGSFSEAQNCEATTLNGVSIPMTKNEKIVAGSFYVSENDSSCETKNIQCFNGEYYWASDATFTSPLKDTEIGTVQVFDTCNIQCKGFDNITYKNLGEKDSFYQKKDTQLCTESEKSELICGTNGQWYNSTGEVIAIPIRESECKKSCTYSDNGTITSIDNGGSIVTYKTAGTQCGATADQIKITCNTGTWKSGGIETSQDVNAPYNWILNGDTLFSSCTQNTEQCKLSWKNSDNTSGSLLLNKYQTLAENLEAATNQVSLGGLYTINKQTNDDKCTTAWIDPRNIECNESLIIQNTVKAIALPQVYSYCHKTCELPGSDQELDPVAEGTVRSMYQYNNGTNQCKTVSAICGSTGKWYYSNNTDIKLSNDFSVNPCPVNPGDSTEITDTQSDITDIIQNIKEEEKGFKKTDTPFSNIKTKNDIYLSNLKDKKVSMTDQKNPTKTIPIYDAYTTTESDDNLFKSPLQDPNATIDLFIRINKNGANTVIPSALQTNSERRQDTIVVKWKLTGKDENGDVITLSPSFNYTADKTSSEYGCGKSMICMDYVYLQESLYTGSDEIILTIANDGLEGKIISNSTDPVIAEKVIEINTAGTISIQSFIKEFMVAYPELEVFYETPVGEDASFKNIAYKLKIQSNSNVPLSDGRFIIESTGAYGGSQQKIKTIVENQQLNPVFEYVIFGE